MRVLDLFSGCGGLSCGFADQGFEIIAGLDHWDDALLTFSHNHPNSAAIKADLAKPMDWQGLFSTEVDVIVGGPPCQGFSISGKRDPDDDRNRLYRAFVEAVRELAPPFFVMENVPNLQSMRKGAFAAAIRQDFEELGYDVHSRVLLASDFGVPQKRRRLFFVGMLNSFGMSFGDPFPRAIDGAREVSTWDAISDLPEASVQDGADYPCEPLSSYQSEMRAGTNELWNHQITNHTERTRNIISLVPDGGNYKDLPQELQGTRKVNIAWTRLSSNQPSYTIDTGHRHHFHYEFDRVPTVRESARIQSFRDDFVFLGSKTSQLKQVGNAVPPKLAALIAKEISGMTGLRRSA